MGKKAPNSRASTSFLRADLHVSIHGKLKGAEFTHDSARSPCMILEIIPEKRKKFRRFAPDPEILAHLNFQSIPSRQSIPKKTDNSIEGSKMHPFRMSISAGVSAVPATKFISTKDSRSDKRSSTLEVWRQHRYLG